MIAALKNKREQDKFEKTISPHGYTVDSSTSKTTTIIVRSPANDRNKVKMDVENKFKRANFIVKTSRSGGSVGSTDIIFESHTIKIMYKPVSGGMSETTLNSTITELAPSLAFMNGKKSFKTVEDFYKFLKTAKPGGVYLNTNDAKAGSQFIESMPSSSKFKEKMENAMGILKFLWEKNSEMPIAQLYWGYRAKPEGIPATHKGDIFIKFGNGKMLGVSLKAGGEKTAEPQLNTYVNKMFDDYDREKQKQVLVKEVHSKIHSSLGLPVNWQDRSERTKSLDTIIKYKKKYPDKYEALYDQMLEIIRNGVIKNVNADMAATIEYIKKQVLKKDESVPLVVVKAFGKNFKFVTDEDALDTFIPEIKSIKAYSSKSSKQNWHIDLIGKKKTITMNMTVRSNKTEPDNKVAQGYNLAIKFNGITQT
jgi:hypothetical protein